MVSLRKMTDDEFEAFFDDDIAAFASEKVRAGNWSPEESIEKSRAAHSRLLPEGLHSPHQHFFTIEAEGEAVGRLWLSTDPEAGAGTGFIYDLFVEEKSRRRGVASEAMRLLEREARRLGLTRLALHVFAFNTQARDLYDKLGYQVTNLNMAKSIADTDSP